MLQTPLSPYDFQVLLIIHVMSAMYWFGTAAFLPRGIREALQAGTGEAGAMIRSVAGQSSATVRSGAVVLLTGILLAVLRGFPKVSPMLPVRFHVALLLSLIWFGIGALLVRPAMASLVDATCGAAAGEATRLRKRISMLTGIQHLLFTVTTVLMLWRL